MAKKDDHPSFPHPTILEALCEVHFELSPENPWSPSLPVNLSKRIGKDYPRMQPMRDLLLQFEVGPHGLGQQVAPAGLRFRFEHKNGKSLIQLAENILTVNFLAPYPGWQAMQPEILGSWQKAVAALKPSSITRVGLRYINRIEFATAEDRPGKWLKESDYIPAAVLRSGPGFLSRVEEQQDDQNRLVVTVGYQPPSEIDSHGAAIFDIDRIVERRLSVGKAVLRQITEQMHNDIWRVFAGAKTPRLERLLKGEQA